MQHVSAMSHVGMAELNVADLPYAPGLLTCCLTKVVSLVKKKICYMDHMKLVLSNIVMK